MPYRTTCSAFAGRAPIRTSSIATRIEFRTRIADTPWQGDIAWQRARLMPWGTWQTSINPADAWVFRSRACVWATHYNGLRERGPDPAVAAFKPCKLLPFVVGFASIVNNDPCQPRERQRPAFSILCSIRVGRVIGISVA